MPLAAARVTQQEMDDLRTIAAGQGLTVSEWIRQQIHQAQVETIEEPWPPPETSHYPQWTWNALTGRVCTWCGVPETRHL